MIYPERNCKNLYSCGMARWHIPTYALCQRGNKLPRLLGIYYTTGNRSNISGRMWKAHHADHIWIDARPIAVMRWKVRSGNCKQARALFILLGPQPGLIYKLLPWHSHVRTRSLSTSPWAWHRTRNARLERHENFDACGPSQKLEQFHKIPSARTLNINSIWLLLIWIPFQGTFGHKKCFQSQRIDWRKLGASAFAPMDPKYQTML